jgi:hypothetical protein
MTTTTRSFDKEKAEDVVCGFGDEVRTVAVEGAHYRTAARNKSKKARIHKGTFMTLQGVRPLDPKGRTYANFSSSPVPPTVIEGAECARTDAIKLQIPFP